MSGINFKGRYFYGDKSDYYEIYGYLADKYTLTGPWYSRKSWINEAIESINSGKSYRVDNGVTKLGSRGYYLIDSAIKTVRPEGETSEIFYGSYYDKESETLYETSMNGYSSYIGKTSLWSIGNGYLKDSSITNIGETSFDWYSPYEKVEYIRTSAVTAKFNYSNGDYYIVKGYINSLNGGGNFSKGDIITHTTTHRIFDEKTKKLSQSKLPGFYTILSSDNKFGTNNGIKITEYYDSESNKTIKPVTADWKYSYTGLGRETGQLSTLNSAITDFISPNSESDYIKNYYLIKGRYFVGSTEGSYIAFEAKVDDRDTRLLDGYGGYKYKSGDIERRSETVGHFNHLAYISYDSVEKVAGSTKTHLDITGYYDSLTDSHLEVLESKFTVPLQGWKKNFNIGISGGAYIKTGRLDSDKTFVRLNPQQFQATYKGYYSYIEGRYQYANGDYYLIRGIAADQHGGGSDYYVRDESLIVGPEASDLDNYHTSNPMSNGNYIFNKNTYYKPGKRDSGIEIYGYYHSGTETFYTPSSITLGTIGIGSEKAVFNLDDMGEQQIDNTTILVLAEVNSAPLAINLTSSSVDENIADLSKVATLSTTDSNSGDTFTYSLVSGTGDTDNSAFTIDNNILKINESPDYEIQDSYSIRLQTTDSGGLTFEQSLTLGVNDVNESPTSVSSSEASFKWWISEGSTIATLSTTDEDSGDFHTYSLVSGEGDSDNDLFTIRGNSININSIENNLKETYSIRLQTKDTNGLIYQSSLNFEASDFDVLENLNAGHKLIRSQGRDIIVPRRFAKIGNAFARDSIDSITIPNSVVKIKDYAFQFQEIPSIVIPGSVKKIGKEAFSGSQLSSITLESGVSEIGKASFYELEKLTFISIPDTVKTIKSEAFAGSALESIELNSGLQTIGYAAFSNNKLGSTSVELEIPETVTSIGDYAFYGNELTSIRIPDSVREIGVGAFDNNPLESISISEDAVFNLSILPEGVEIIRRSSNTNHMSARALTTLIGSDENDSADAVSCSIDGSVYITGTTFGDLDDQINNGNSDIFLTKRSKDGISQWTRIFGSESDEWSKSICISTDQSIFITGSTSGSFDGESNSGTYDIFISKYSSDGSKQWTRFLGSSSIDFASSISATRDGSVVVTGYTAGDLDGQENSGGHDVFISKYSSDGARQWTRLLGTEFNDAGSSIATADDGSVFITGTTKGSLDGQENNGNNDVLISKYSSDGTKQWTRLLGSSSNDVATSISATKDGLVFLTGYTTGDLDGQENSGSSDAFLSIYFSDGTKSSTRLLGTSSTELAKSVHQTANNIVYIAGYTAGNLDGRAHQGNGDAFLSKYNFSNQPTSVTLSTTQFDEEIPSNSIIANLKSTSANENHNFTYALVNGKGDDDNKIFTIEGDKLRINERPDYETQDHYSIRIQTRSADGLTYEKPIILSVKDLIYLEASKTSFDENIDAGSTIASLSVDQDPNIL